MTFEGLGGGGLQVKEKLVDIYKKTFSSLISFGLKKWNVSSSLQLTLFVQFLVVSFACMGKKNNWP